MFFFWEIKHSCPCSFSSVSQSAAGHIRVQYLSSAAQNQKPARVAISTWAAAPPLPSPHRSCFLASTSVAAMAGSTPPPQSPAALLLTYPTWLRNLPSDPTPCSRQRGFPAVSPPPTTPASTPSLPDQVPTPRPQPAVLQLTSISRHAPALNFSRPLLPHQILYKLGHVPTPPSPSKEQPRTETPSPFATKINSS